MGPVVPDAMDYKTASFHDRMNAHIAGGVRPIMEKLELVHADQMRLWETVPPWVMQQAEYVKQLQDIVTSPVLESHTRLRARMEEIDGMLTCMNKKLTVMRAELIDKKSAHDPPLLNFSVLFGCVLACVTAAALQSQFGFRGSV